MPWFRKPVDDLGVRVLEYVVLNSEGIGRPMRLREFFLENPTKAYDIRTIMAVLIEAGYINREDLGTDERFENLRDENVLHDPGVLTMKNASLPVSLTRSGLLHYADVKRGRAQLRLIGWQIPAFWVTFVVATWSGLTTIQKGGWWPFGRLVSSSSCEASSKVASAPSCRKCSRPTLDPTEQAGPLVTTLLRYRSFKSSALAVCLCAPKPRRRRETAQP